MGSQLPGKESGPEAEMEGAVPGFECPPEKGCKRPSDMPEKQPPPALFLSGDPLRSRVYVDRREDVSVLGWATGFVGPVGRGGLEVLVDGPGPGLVFSLWFGVEPGWGTSRCRHVGQVPFCFNHGRMQEE